MNENKTILGLYERIQIISKTGELSEPQLSRIDTGATKSSIDMALAGRYSLGPIIKTSHVRNANGNKIRPVIEVEIIIEGKKIKGEFTLADRRHMTYPVLIGQNILKKNDFLIDPDMKTR